MKTLFVGSKDRYLSEIACAHDKSAYLLHKKNYQEFINQNIDCTGFTSLSDLPKNTEIFLKILLSSDVIFYCPSEEWITESKKQNLFDSTYTEQGLTEHFLLFVSTKKKVFGLEHINNHHNTLNIDVRRKTFDPVLWTAGCSNTAGTGVNISETYSYLLSKSLKMQCYNLAQAGTSNQWSADRILRSDIRKGDIIIWGLTNSERITWIENNNIVKINPSYFDTNEINKKILSLRHLMSENTLHTNLISIEQVANFCNKIGATFVCFLTLPTDSSLYKFLFNKNYYLNIDFEFSIGENNQWNLQRIDYGTDNLHPGPLHHQYWHDKILQYLGTNKISTKG